MRLSKEQAAFSLSAAIQNSTSIIPYSYVITQGFSGVRMHSNTMHKEKEGLRGEFALCIPLSGQAGGRSEKT